MELKTRTWVEEGTTGIRRTHSRLFYEPNILIVKQLPFFFGKNKAAAEFPATRQTDFSLCRTSEFFVKNLMTFLGGAY